MIGIYFGGRVRVSIGRDLVFTFSTQDASGTEITYGANTVSSVAFYLNKQEFQSGTSQPDPVSGTPKPMARINTTSHYWRPSAAAGYYTISSTDFSRGDVGTLQVRVTDSNNDTHDYFFDIEITDEEAVEKQISTDIADTEADDFPNSIIGRLYTLEKNQIEVLMPRLKRTLGLLGEHQVVDGFVYDDDGNITQCRVRIFEDKADAQGCNRWTDTLNADDPATSLETGEIARYTTLVSNLLPRNLRTLYDQRISTDATDNAYGQLGSTGGGSTL